MNELIIINIGYGCAFIALAIKEVLWLRIILTVSFILRFFSLKFTMFYGITLLVNDLSGLVSFVMLL